MSAAHVGFVTVTCWPETASVPFHSELTDSPVGRSKLTVQPWTVAAELFATVYSAWNPLVQSWVLANVAVTVPEALPVAPAVNAATVPTPMTAAVVREIPTVRARFVSAIGFFRSPVFG